MIVGGWVGGWVDDSGWMGGWWVLGGLVTCVCVYDQNTACSGLTVYMRYVLRLC